MFPVLAQADCVRSPRTFWGTRTELGPTAEKLGKHVALVGKDLRATGLDAAVEILFGSGPVQGPVVYNIVADTPMLVQHRGRVGPFPGHGRLQALGFNYVERLDRLRRSAELVVGPLFPDLVDPLDVASVVASSELVNKG